MPEPAFDFEAGAGTCSARNAYWLGRMAALAYADAHTIRETLAGFGLDGFHFIEGGRTDTQVFVAGRSDMIVVAFRGTQATDIHDWFTDAQVALVDGVHDGFRRALAEVWPRVHEAIIALQGTPLSFAEAAAGKDPGTRRSLWFTGHSLGAALAALGVAELLGADRPVDGLYTFGQPRTGGREWAERFDGRFRARAFRYVNNNDLVTRVPPRELGYSHVGTFRYFGAGGDYHEDIDRWRLLLDRVRGGIGDFMRLGPDALKDHAMAAYLACLERHRAQVVAGGSA